MERARRLTRRAVASRRLIVAFIPLAWLVIFFVVPFLVALKISVSEPVVAQPPYAPMMTIEPGGKVSIDLNFGNFGFLLSDPLYVTAYLESIRIAFVSTLLCLVVGYPMAYFIARSPSHLQNLLLVLVILPFWTSFLLRVYAWIGILKDNGILNNVLMGLGIVSAPLQLIQTDFAVYVGIVYTYLPFMVLPLYSTLSKLDGDLLDAASDLGARPLTTFLTVTLPLSLPGIVAGSLLVFVPAIGEYVIPALLGGPDTLMIGRILWDEFFLNRDWPVASAVAIAILIVVVLPIVLVRRGSAEAGR